MQYIIGSGEKREQVIIYNRQNKTLHKMYNIWNYYKTKFGNPINNSVKEIWKF